MTRSSKKKRTRRIIVGVVCAFFLLCMYAGVSYISQQQYMQLREIRVTGTELVSRDKIEKLVQKIAARTRWGSISSSTVLTLPSDEIIEQMYLAFPEVAHVSVVPRYMSNTADVVVREHQIYARWCAPESADCYYMTREGYLFAPAQAVPGLITWHSAPPTNPLRANVGGEHMSTMRALVDNLSAVMPISWVRIVSPREIEMHTETFYIIARADKPAEDTVRIVTKALHSRTLEDVKNSLLYIDARFGTRLFYKTRTGEDVPIVDTGQ